MTTSSVPIWRGPLRDLLPRMTEIAGGAPGQWMRYAMPRGAQLALRVLRDGRRELAIARETTKPGLGPWETEVQTFLRYFEIEDWKLATRERSRGRWLVIYREPGPTTTPEGGTP